MHLALIGLELQDLTFGGTHWTFGGSLSLYLELPKPFAIVWFDIAASSIYEGTCVAGSASMVSGYCHKTPWFTIFCVPSGKSMFQSNQCLKEDFHFWDTYDNILCNNPLKGRKLVVQLDIPPSWYCQNFAICWWSLLLGSQGGSSGQCWHHPTCSCAHAFSSCFCQIAVCVS